jgi:hypothetical protein
LFFRLAQQQGISIAALMGLRPVGYPMSSNEIGWWAAFRNIAPLSSEIMDINIQALTGKNIDWFNPMDDEEYAEHEALELKEKNKEAREKLKKERLEKERLKRDGNKAN